jgi:hypothetical protein
LSSKVSAGVLWGGREKNKIGAKRGE